MKTLKGAGTIDAMSTMYPARLHMIAGKRAFDDIALTVYGAVVSGRVKIQAPGLSANLEAGGFFGLPGPCDLEADGEVMVVERVGHRAVPCLGRIEERGRLVYIDGCSDTVLCAPARLGDPVLNHLHFPAGTDQSVHIHPSTRLGVVVRGRGVAFGPGWQEPLERGKAFLLVEHEKHAFRTTDESMDIIAFHPDSDWGPTDAAHPMLNRTYLCKPGKET
jgi:hypothetical protein